jgi:metal-dependent amidase/aminoacylase/carboxypeptidase family protein
MLPTLRAVAGKDKVVLDPAVMGAEDFSFIKIKFWFISLGGAPKGKPISETAPHHTPDFTLTKVDLYWVLKQWQTLL